MERVMIVGSAGSGKSTLARQLGQALDLPVVHIDRLYWSPGWAMRPPNAIRRDVATAASGPRWVFEGNNSATFAVRAARADAVVFLDLPAWLCLARVLRRVATSHGRVRPDMAPGCPERFDPAFLRWIAGHPRTGRPKALRLLADAPAHAQRHHLRSPREVQAFLRALGATGAGA